MSFAEAQVPMRVYIFGVVELIYEPDKFSSLHFVRNGSAVINYIYFFAYALIRMFLNGSKSRLNIAVIVVRNDGC